MAWRIIFLPDLFYTVNADETLEREREKTFHLKDFYLLLRDPDFYFLGLLTESQNLFAFKSAETTLINSKSLSLGSSEKDWYEKYGFSIQEGYVARDIEARFSGDINKREQDLTLAIAKYYNLVIYQGLLVRI